MNQLPVQLLCGVGSSPPAWLLAALASQPLVTALSQRTVNPVAVGLSGHCERWASERQTSTSAHQPHDSAFLRKVMSSQHGRQHGACVRLLSSWKTSLAREEDDDTGPSASWEALLQTPPALATPQGASMDRGGPPGTAEVSSLSQVCSAGSTWFCGRTKTNLVLGAGHI